MRLKRGQLAEPETVVGNCCGCGKFPRALFKVPGLYRYRCDECFERETGYRHHLSVDIPRHCKSPDECKAKLACTAACWKLDVVPA